MILGPRKVDRLLHPSEQEENMNYVVYSVEMLRDGSEESAKVVRTKEEAVNLINHWYHTSVAAGNTQFRLFELGKEIPISLEKVEEPQPPIIRTRYKL